MAMETKITKYLYGSDRGGLKLVNESGVSFLLCNRTGDGEFPLYFIEAQSWGPNFFDDKNEYEKYHEFEKHHRAEYIMFLDMHKGDPSWKVVFEDVSDYANEGITLSWDKYHAVSIKKKDNTFYIYAYYRGVW